MGRMKDAYEERLNKRKAKPSKICKVHKGAHAYEVKTCSSSVIGSAGVVIEHSVCACGKKSIRAKELKAKDEIEDFVKYCAEKDVDSIYTAFQEWSEYNFLYGSDVPVYDSNLKRL